MFDFLNKEAKKDIDIDFNPAFLDTAPVVPMSEGMIKRDNYFHSCWVLLKSKRPDLCEEMQKVELILAGYDPEGDKPEEPKKTDKPKGQIL